MRRSPMIAAALCVGGLYLAFLQAQGIQAYVGRGASLGDAMDTTTLLLLATALLVVASGALMMARPRLALLAIVPALALNGLILQLTRLLGTDRPVWIAGAICEGLLVLAAVLSILVLRRKTA